MMFGGTAAAVIAAAVATFAAAGPVIAFVLTALALSLLAMMVGHATEELGSRLGAGATGVLQSALGNLPELFVCIFSLRAGLVTVVQSALVGSILANSLLVLGLAILVGGVRHGRQTFSPEAPRMIGTLMLVAVGALAVPTLAAQLHTPAAAHVDALSAACAVLVLIVFAASIPFSLSDSPEQPPSQRTATIANAMKRPPAEVTDDAAAVWPLWLSIATLCAAGIGAAFVSEWFVRALEPAMHALHLSDAFAGLVVVAIAGNAVENVVGIQLAAKNKPEYAISVILNSSLQIALGLVPVLVLLSFVLGGPVLTLVLPPLLVVALLLTTVITAVIVNDGETIWLEGLALLGLYGITAAAFWWG